jgi:type IV pilus assembly protein PilX
VRRRPAAIPRAHGTTLITSLLLLLVLTVIGITSMQMSRVEERMAGNTRDLSMAFQGAEAALRNGEALIGEQASRPSDCTGIPCATTPEVFLEGVLGQVENEPSQWWDAGNALPFTDAAGNTSMQGEAVDPTFVIEHMGFVRTDGGVEMGINPPSGRDFYQVTAHSDGASGNANVVLQSTYARKF